MACKNIVHPIPSDCDFRYSSGYGYRKPLDLGNGKKSSANHKGVDIAVPLPEERGGLDENDHNKKEKNLGSKSFIIKFVGSIIFVLFIFFTNIGNSYASSKDICQPKNFQNFWNVFISNMEVQKKYVSNNIEYSKVLQINWLHEPTTFITMLEKQDIYFPVFLSFLEQNNTLQKKFLKKNEFNIVRSFKKDTDYLIEHYFKFTNGCFYLQKIKNWSL